MSEFIQTLALTVDRIEALKAENARLRAALEWALDEATDSAHPHYPYRGEHWAWEYPYLVSGTPFGGSVGHAGLSTALEAVEAAALEAKP